MLDAHLLPEFGTVRIETITPEQFERWRDRLAKDGARSRETVNKIATQAHAVLQHAVEHFGLTVNVASQVRRLRESSDPGRFDFFSPHEVELLVATATRGAHRDPSRPAVSEAEQALRAEEDRQDGVIYLAAALAGLRLSELLALLWQDVDFEHSSIRVHEGYAAKKTGKPKSRRSRTVPMVDQLAAALNDLNGRGHHAARRDHVFISRFGTELDGSALRRRYIATRDAAGLRPLRFHEYADVLVMPMSLRRGCSERFSLVRGRHNQSASRKARSVSVG